MALAVVGALAATASVAQAAKRPKVIIGAAAIRANGAVGPDETSVGIRVTVNGRNGARIRGVQAYAVLQGTTNRSTSSPLRFRPKNGGWTGRVTIPRNTSTRATRAEVWVVANTSIGERSKMVGTVAVKAANNDPNQPPPPPDI